MKTDKPLVVCAVIFQDDKILAAQRGPGQHQAGLWEFPGGKVESGETLEEAIQREIREELDCGIRVTGKLPESEGDFPIRLIPLLCELTQGSPKAKEHQDIRWCSLEDLQNLPWCPADIPIVKKLILS